MLYLILQFLNAVWIKKRLQNKSNLSVNVCLE